MYFFKKNINNVILLMSMNLICIKLNGLILVKRKFNIKNNFLKEY